MHYIAVSIWKLKNRVGRVKTLFLSQRESVVQEAVLVLLCVLVLLLVLVLVLVLLCVLVLCLCMCLCLCLCLCCSAWRRIGFISLHCRAGASGTPRRRLMPR